MIVNEMKKMKKFQWKLKEEETEGKPHKYTHTQIQIIKYSSINV